MPPIQENIPKDATSASNLKAEAQDVWNVLLGLMEQDVREASLAVECLCTLLGPSSRDFEAADCHIHRWTDAVVRTYIGTSIKRRDGDTCTRQEEAFEGRGTARARAKK